MPLPYPMFYDTKHFRETQFQQGCRDREAGLLPKAQNSEYLDGYLSDRPRGLDDKIRYFPSLEAYLRWQQKGRSKT